MGSLLAASAADVCLLAGDQHRQVLLAMHQLDPLVSEVHNESPEPKRFASGTLPNLFSDEHVENQLGPHGWSSDFTNKQVNAV